MSATATTRRPPRKHIPVWAIVLMILAGLIITPLVGIVAFVIWSISSSFSPPDVNAAVTQVQSMRCVTWARSFTDGGGVDVSKSAIIQVGLEPGCTAADIDATYASLYKDTAAVWQSADVKVDYLVTDTPPEREPDDFYSTTRSTVAQLTMDRIYNSPSRSEFAGVVDDWLSIRDRVDPGAQVQLLGTDLYSQADERFIANSTADELRTLSTTLPDRLRAQAWKVTVPARGGIAFLAEDTAPAGGVTFETSKGFPDPWLVDVGVQLNGAWPDNGDPEYVYLFRDPPISAGHGFNEFSARIFNVDRSQAGEGAQPAAPETTIAWPALTSAVDAMHAMDAQGGEGTFSLGFALYPRPFTPNDAHPEAVNSVTVDPTLTVFSSDTCAPAEHTASASGVLVGSLCRYWVKRAS